MYLLLLVFGAFLGLAGVVLSAAGVSLRDGSFDPAILTPGILATLGGLLLIGFGAGLRSLQRIEQTLATRPMPRPLPIPDTKPIELGEAAREAAPLPLVLRPGRNAPTADDAVQGHAEEEPRDPPSREKSSLALPAMEPANPIIADANPPATTKGANGAGAKRATAQASAGAIAPAERKKAPAFDLLWPKRQRSHPASEPAPAQNATVPAVEAQKSLEESNQPAARADSPMDGLSVLKSGIVNGMPYTLFSDGSIEAQLPEGTLRFGSITELRNHIEQSA
jgi:hypothetical protein